MKFQVKLDGFGPILRRATQFASNLVHKTATVGISRHCAPRNDMTTLKCDIVEVVTIRNRKELLESQQIQFVSLQAGPSAMLRTGP